MDKVSQVSPVLDAIFSAELGLLKSRIRVPGPWAEDTYMHSRSAVGQGHAPDPPCVPSRGSVYFLGLPHKGPQTGGRNVFSHLSGGEFKIKVSAGPRSLWKL